MPNADALRILHGMALSPGLAEGRAFVHRDLFQLLDVPVAIERKDVEVEVGHLESSTVTITGDLLLLAARVEREMDSSMAAVFEAHQLMLNDPELKRELRSEIQNKLVSANSAVKAVFLRWEKRFLLMESQMAQQKGADLRDIANRLSNALSGIKVHPLEQIPPGRVLVTRRLLPSDTVFLAQCSTAAVLLEFGRAGSHASLFMRAMGLPCVAGIGHLLHLVPADAQVLVNADQGEVAVQPTDERASRFQREVADRSKVRAAARVRAQEPAITQDGVPIAVLANVGNREDTERALENGADGIGLYRTEQAYLGRATLPTADELLEEVRRTIEPARGKPIHVRLLDLGADKQLPFLGFLAETNPALGRRGIRLQIELPPLLELQLRVFLQLSEEFDLRILIPLVTLPQDVVCVRNGLARLAAERPSGVIPPLGAMIETPAAALSMRDLEPLLDFASFGTNDLTQYTFAADRENAAVEQYFNDSDAVIFRLLRIAHGDAPRLPLSICGELAGRAAHIPRLLRCGIRSLSVVPLLIPDIKEAVRSARIE